MDVDCVLINAKISRGSVCCVWECCYC